MNNSRIVEKWEQMEKASENGDLSRKARYQRKYNKASKKRDKYFYG